MQMLPEGIVRQTHPLSRAGPISTFVVFVAVGTDMGFGAHNVGMRYAHFFVCAGKG